MLRRTPLLVLATAVLVVASGCASSASDDAGRTDPAPTSTTAGSADTGAPAVERSAGCDADPVDAGRTTETVTSGDDERAYLRYDPSGLTADQASPLVLDLTAYSPASMEEAFSGFTTKAADGTVPADQGGVVVVTPEPTNGAGTLLTWNYVGTPGWSDDQAFITDLLDEVEATTCIDTARVFVAGFAVGGVFGSILACDQTDRFAALATVSGLYSPEGCQPSKPLPVLSFHGTGDRFIPFDGGIGTGPADLPLSPETTAGLTFMAEREGALASSEAWAAHDGCDPEPQAQPVTDGVTLQVWSGCDDDVDVALYVIDGGEHTWPGSTGMGDYTALLGPVSDQVDATALIWDFFLSQTG
jgi:polyhydroxybutyrate depolymerase